MRALAILPTLLMLSCATTQAVADAHPSAHKVKPRGEAIETEMIAYEVPLDLTQHMAAAGPGFSDSFTVDCLSTAATAIQATGQQAYTCQNPSTTVVAIGDSGIANPATPNSPTYCKTNCPSQEWGGAFRKEYCRAQTGTVTIYCRALVATSSAP